MSITPLPPAPAITDTTSEFNTKAFNFVAALDPMVTEINAELPAIAQAGDASSAALAAANYKGEWSALTGALAIPASVSHNDKVWLLTVNIADVTTKEPGVAAEWQEIGAGLPVGALQYFAGSTTSTYPGEEWLLCDGSIVTQTAYSDLYGKIGTLPDGINTWTARTSGTSSIKRALIYANNTFVYAGNGGVLATSTDAITWTARTSGTTTTINALAFGNNTFVYATQAGLIATSTDAITWTARTSGTASAILALTYGNGLFVYAGNGGVLATSTDAITWTARTSGTTSLIRVLTYGASGYVYAGDGVALASSTNAITWTARTNPSSAQPNVLIYADGKYLLGTGDSIVISTDAITWTIYETVVVYALAYGNGLYLSHGGGGLAYNNGRVSKDGIKWYSVSFSGVILPTITFAQNKFIMAGNDSNIYDSVPYTYNTSIEFSIPNSTDVSLVDLTTNQVFIKAL